MLIVIDLFDRLVIQKYQSSPTRITQDNKNTTENINLLQAF